MVDDGRIHLAANLGLMFLVVVAGGVAIGAAAIGLAARACLIAVWALIVLWVGDRLAPRITGPIIERLLARRRSGVRVRGD
jgi:hypothetical protein